MRAPVLGLTLVSLAVLAAPGLAGKPYVTKVDPVDGIEWRGDQFHARSARPAAGGRFDQDGVFEVENVRWGFLPPDDGTERWRPQFATTRIDVRSARRLTYVLNPFPPRFVAGHSALLVEFDDAGALVNQATGARSQGLVISVEARFRPGEKYGFMRGFLGSSYPLIYMLSTWEDYQQRVLEMHGGDLERYVFTLSPEESREVARAGVAEALKDHRGEKYHLTRGSCVTRMIDLLNVGLPQDRKLKRKFLGGVFVHLGMSFPSRLPGILARRGLIGERLEDLKGGGVDAEDHVDVPDEDPAAEPAADAEPVGAED